MRVSDGYNSQAGVDLQPLGIGQTDVSIIQPPGFADSGKLTFNVTMPGFKTTNVLMGKDTAVTSGITLLDNVQSPTVNATVTITSTDPSRVLFSRDANSTPAATITSPLIAGQRFAGGVMMHALANNGIVPVKITAPGYASCLLRRNAGRQ